jgi:hypothetical protein
LGLTMKEYPYFKPTARLYEDKELPDVEIVTANGFIAIEKKRGEER